jgi:SMODS-associating 2TM, beta-strand rich effector domain
MLVLAIVAICLAYLLDRSLSTLHLKAPWWLDTPAVLGFYGLCWRLYDEYLWRLGPVTRTLSGVPNLAGQWSGTILSSYADQDPVKAMLVVRQTSSRLLLTLETDTSRSYSTMASLCAAPGPPNGLHYVFANTPRSLSKETMRPHAGTAQLTLSADGSHLTGDYEANRFRATNGRMDFYRITSSADAREQSKGKPHAHT